MPCQRLPFHGADSPRPVIKFDAFPGAVRHPGRGSHEARGNQLEIKNFMEDVVASYVDEVCRTDKDLCDCERCRLDVMALALNDLKPKYVVLPKGYAYARMDELEAQFQADTIVAVTKALKLVKESPRHTPDRM